MLREIEKRDGRKVAYQPDNITRAIYKAMNDVSKDSSLNYDTANNLSKLVENHIFENYFNKELIPSVEQIQDIIEKVLVKENLPEVAKSYILYRDKRSQIREMKDPLMKIYQGITFDDTKDNDLKRENANIDGNTAMGTMLRYGSEGAKRFNELFVLKPEHSKAHINGDIHIHDLDFLTLTMTCCQIDLSKLFKDGFFTGHGHLREPQSIRTAAELACIAIQSNQNDQHGGQSIPALDYYLAPYVDKSFAKYYKKNMIKAIELIFDKRNVASISKAYNKLTVDEILSVSNIDRYQEAELDLFSGDATLIVDFKKAQNFAKKHSIEEVEEETHQALEAFIHNCNTLAARAGAQVPFSSVNLGTDTSYEGRLVTKNLLRALDDGLGKHETSIFPVTIFKVKEGINYNKEDPNYDLFEYACRVSSKRLFPNFSFIDAPFNLKYYKEGNINTEIAYMGCRTRLINNRYDPSREIVTGRGNLSFTTINLPRLGILANHDVDKFFKMLDEKLDLVIDQLLDRMKIQSRRKVKNFPFLMGQGVWIDSEKLGWEDNIEEVIKHGSLTVGFIGLAETLVALIGKHHGESDEAQELGLKIVKYMSDKMNEASEKYHLNFGVIGTPAEGLSSRFTKMDKKKFGIIPGVTDREYYTNSSHIPVYYPITAYEKIKKEAAYHPYEAAGHITYVEMDGDPSQNIEAFIHIVKAMKEAGVGYGAINHPVDRDPICGFSGVISGDICPGCGRKESDGPKFEKIRRITGYLVGTLDRFNDGKKAEEHDRVKHSI